MKNESDDQLSEEELASIEKQNRTPTEAFCYLLGSTIVDGIAQLFLTSWTCWIVLNLSGREISYWLWWLGMTLVFVILDNHNYKISGKLLVKKIQLMMILTLGIWIFK